jgi:hypothetical protein
MLVVGPSDVEAVRIGEPVRVAVGGGVDQMHRGPFRNHGAADLDIGGDAAAGEELHRGLQPLDLFDRAGQKMWPVAHLVVGTGVAQKCQHTVGDGVDRRVVPGDQQQYRIGQHLPDRHRAVGAVVVQQS